MNSTWYGSSYNDGYENPIIYVAPARFAYPTDANMHLGVMDYDPEYIRENPPNYHTIEPPMPIGSSVSPELRERSERAYETLVNLQRNDNERMAKVVENDAVEDMKLRRLAQLETFQGIYGQYNKRLETKRMQESIQRERLERKRIQESIQRENRERKRIQESIKRERRANGGLPVNIQVDGEFYNNVQMITDEHGLHAIVVNPYDPDLVTI